MKLGNHGRGKACTTFLTAALTFGCGAASSSPSSAKTTAVAATVAPFFFTTTLGAKHPLVGLFYDPAARATVTSDAVRRRVQSARFVFLGEKHDNVDHHRFEATTILYAAEDRKAAVVMEMIAEDKQPALDAVIHAPTPKPGDVATAVEWAKTGWPPFVEYEPVVRASLLTNARLYGGDLPSAAAHAIAHRGAEAIEPALVTDFHLSTPVPADQEAALEKEIADVHCGMLPPDFVPRMVLAQRARDATLAETVLTASRQPAMASARPPDVVVLISGNGHARTDRAVPKLVRDHLRADAGERGRDETVSIGLLEVDDAKLSPEAYAAEFGATVLPFDFVFFTPRANDDDPCEKMQRPSK